MNQVNNVEILNDIGDAAEEKAPSHAADPAPPPAEINSGD
jgi:hypothetical protein